MLKIRKIIKIITGESESYTLEHHLFLSSIIYGIFASLLGATINLILYTSIPAVLIPFSLAALLVAFYFLLRARKDISPFVFPINTVAIIAISIIWVFNGGIDGSNVMPGFVILLLALITVKKGQKRYIITLFLSVFTVAYFIQFFRPDLITQLPSEENRWIDSYVTLVYSTFFIYLLVLFIHKYFDIEKRKSDRSEEKYRKIFENVQDVFYQIELGGNILEISPSIKTFSGYERCEVINKHATMLFPNLKAFSVLISKLKINSELSDEEILLKTKNGEEKFASVNAKLIVNYRGRPTHIEGTLRDITQRKIFELQLLDAKEKAEESNRLKSAFLTNMSHEIRTPLNSIMGFASLLPEEENKDLIKTYSDLVYQNSEQLVSIIDGIVLYSKLQTRQFSLHFVKFEINNFLIENFSVFNHSDFHDNIDYSVEVGFNRPIEIETDQEKFKQIFINLLSNAFKFTLKGEIRLGYSIEDDKIEFFVKDTGIGIPEKDLPFIFDRFFRGSNINVSTVRGTGIGLSIAKELVELLGGQIRVESEVEVGSSFYFTMSR